MHQLAARRLAKPRVTNCGMHDADGLADILVSDNNILQQRRVSSKNKLTLGNNGERKQSVTKLECRMAEQGRDSRARNWVRVGVRDTNPGLLGARGR